MQCQLSKFKDYPFTLYPLIEYFGHKTVLLYARTKMPMLRLKPQCTKTHAHANGINF